MPVKASAFQLDFGLSPPKDQSAPNRKGNSSVRYNVDLDLNPGLPTIISEYYGPYCFFDAKQTALARLDEWREESLAQIQERVSLREVRGTAAGNCGNLQRLSSDDEQLVPIRRRPQRARCHCRSPVGPHSSSTQQSSAACVR